MLDANLIEEVLKRANIVDVISSYINVIKKGNRYVAICPFHDDKNPSMMISKEKQIFKCFVCGEGGNAITFIQKFEKIPFEDAVRKLADLIGFRDERLTKNVNKSPVDEEKERLYNTIESLTKFYEISLMANEGKDGLNYLNNRQIDEDIIKQFRIGFAPNNNIMSIQYMQASGHSLKDIETIGVAGHSNGQFVDRNAGRVIFPLFDINGRVIGYSARRIKDNDEAKYINSPETPLFQKGNVIYNYHNAKKSSRLDGYCYLLEGFMDVIALYRAGIKSAVALMGTALTNNQVNLLKRLNVEIRICLDADNPGQMATMKVIEAFDKAGIKYRIVRRSSGPKDADEILDKYGKDKLIKWLNILIDKIQFVMNYFLLNNKLETIDNRKKFITDFLPYLSGVNNELELEEYIVNISKATKFDRKVILAALNKYRKINVDSNYNGGSTTIFESHPERKILHRLELTERAIVYQMINSPSARKFYLEKDVPISDDIFMKIANYVMEYAKEHDNVSVSDLINYVSASDDDQKDQVVSEITALSLEKRYPICTYELLSEYLDIINKERAKKYERFILDKSVEGKSDQEQLKILLEYGKKMEKRLYENKKEN